MCSIKKFDPILITRKRAKKENVICIFLGKRQTGKSTLIQDIINFYKLPYHIVLSVRNIKPSWIDSHKILTNDTILATDRDLKMLTNAVGMFSFLISSSYLMNVPVSFRFSGDYIFILRENSVICQKKIWNTYFTEIYPTFGEFQYYYLKCTENYGCLVLDRGENCVYWYKSPKYQKPNSFL